MKIWFGKYAGQEVCELPDGYLRWLSEEALPPKSHYASTVLERKSLRERWLDLLSEVEDELHDRQ